MPKSKRDKKVSLTKTDKKVVALKQKIVEDVRNCVEKFDSIYVFTYENMRTSKMQAIRQTWKPSRFAFAKNRVIGVGLGRTPEEEIKEGLHKVSKCLKGQCGMLFTDTPKKDVVEWFDTFSLEDYARSGFKATTTVKLDAGPLPQFAHSLEPYLRKLGMPTKLDKGVVTLIKDYTVCEEGFVLNPEQAKILELLDIKLATFNFKLRACWFKDGKFERFTSEVETKDEEDDAEMDEADGD